MTGRIPKKGGNSVQWRTDDGWPGMGSNCKEFSTEHVQTAAEKKQRCKIVEGIVRGGRTKVKEDYWGTHTSTPTHFYSPSRIPLLRLRGVALFLTSTLPP